MATQRGSMMELYSVQENGFQGSVRLSSSTHNRRSFYNFVLSRGSGERLYDGAAGDLSEAVDTMRAHIRYLSAREGNLAAQE